VSEIVPRQKSGQIILALTIFLGAFLLFYVQPMIVGGVDGLFDVFPDEPVIRILLCPFVENLLFSKEADPDSL
jgi:hypothetical protein